MRWLEAVGAFLLAFVLVLVLGVLVMRACG